MVLTGGIVKNHRFSLVILFFIVFTCLAVSCSKDDNVVGPDDSATFEIYLSSDNLYGIEIELLNDVNLIEPPLLTLSDITSYDWKKHFITYPDSVRERLKSWHGLHLKYFVVRVNDESIYYGQFLKDHQSSSRHQVFPLIEESEGEYIIPPSILIEQSDKYIEGSVPDPRNDERIYNALSHTGILVEDDAPYPVPAQKRFSIYLTEQKWPQDVETQLEDFILLEPPLLTTEDIICYSRGNHYISFTDSAWERMKTQGILFNMLFVVCIGEERIYWGRFLHSFVSTFGGNPFISLLIGGPDGSYIIPRAFIINKHQLIDYDPRDDQRIYNALNEASVLVDFYGRSAP
jgi:hypothetical protein